LTIVCIAGAVALLGIAVLSLRSGDENDDPSGLEVVATERLDPRLVEYTVRTPSLSEETRVRVLLPTDYAESSRPYPVLYALHGRNGDYRQWTESLGGAELTRDLPVIVVMPDGGPSGFYSDWYNGGEGGPPMWESYHVDELIPWVDAEFRTVDSKGGRAIAGASMGGFGALSYAGRHPELFAAAASFSGLVDSGYPPAARAFEMAGRTPDGQPALWGARAEHEQLWREHNPLDLASRLRGLRLFLSTGNGQPGGPYGGGPDYVEMIVHATNVRLHQRLASLGITHGWDDYGPGAHDLPYIRRSFALTLPMLMSALDAPAQAVAAGAQPRDRSLASSGGRR
jgi:S-formylglutathione hydrolase FrmB